MSDIAEADLAETRAIDWILLELRGNEISDELAPALLDLVARGRQLKHLAGLKKQGVLPHAEVRFQKAKILES
jgi:hypothetical protein